MRLKSARGTQAGGIRRRLLSRIKNIFIITIERERETLLLLLLFRSVCVYVDNQLTHIHTRTHERVLFQ